MVARGASQSQGPLAGGVRDASAPRRDGERACPLRGRKGRENSRQLRVEPDDARPGAEGPISLLELVEDDQTEGVPTLSCAHVDGQRSDRTAREAVRQLIAETLGRAKIQRTAHGDEYLSRGLLPDVEIGSMARYIFAAAGRLVGHIDSLDEA